MPLRLIASETCTTPRTRSSLATLRVFARWRSRPGTTGNLSTSRMQTVISSNRFVLCLVAFVSGCSGKTVDRGNGSVVPDGGSEAGTGGADAGGSDGGECLGTAALCDAPAQCCSGSCQFGACQPPGSCSLVGESCGGPKSCCAGQCALDTCVEGDAGWPGCGIDGVLCTGWSECCSQACFDGGCGLPSSCTPSAGSCTNPGTCCSLECLTTQKCK